MTTVGFTNAALQSLAERWWILLLEGIATVVLGILLLTNPRATLIAFSLVLGVWWLFTGTLDIIAAFAGRHGSRSWFWTLLGGIVSVVVGAFLLFEPLTGAAVLPVAYTLLFAVGASVSGLFRVMAAVTMRNEVSGEGWIILWGAMAIVLGLWMLTSLKAASAVMVYIVAIFAIVGGVITVFNAFRLRSTKASEAV